MKGIANFGERIEGSRRKTLKVEELSDLKLREELRDIKKDKIWEVPDWTQFDDGRPRVCIYFMKCLRDNLRANIEISDESSARATAEAYKRFMTRARDLAYEIRTEQDISQYFLKLLKPYSDEDGELIADNEYIFYLLDKKMLNSLVYDLRELREECEIQGFPYNFRRELRGVHIKRIVNIYHIYKGKKLLTGEDFRSKEEAIEYINEYYIPISTAKKRKRKVVNGVRPQLKNVERIGPDVRAGRDASGEDFLEQFNFRGGEFGSWNNNLDRQACLNYAYDAFVDLARATRLPLRMIGFGGYKRLAIAFGSRGRKETLAHYEPKNRVINLTKLGGAGSLAHEWGHAFDYAIGEICGFRVSSKFLSGLVYSENSYDIEYKAIRDAMKEVMEAIYKNEISFKEIVDRIRHKMLVCIEVLKRVDDMYLNSGNDIINRLKELISKGNGVKIICYKEVEDMVDLLEDRNIVLKNKLKGMMAGDIEENIHLEIRAIMGEIESSYSRNLDKLLKELGDCRGRLGEKIDKEIKMVRWIRECAEKNIVEELEGIGVEEILGALDSHYARYISVCKSSAEGQPIFISTNYYNNARKLDEDRGRKYNSSHVELFARAFELYVHDRLEKKGIVNKYLVNINYKGVDVSNLKLFPEGEEKLRIHTKIEKLLRVVGDSLTGGYIPIDIEMDRIYREFAVEHRRNKGDGLGEKKEEGLGQRRENLVQETKGKDTEISNIKKYTTELKLIEGLTLKQNLVRMADENIHYIDLEKLLDEIAIRGKINLGYINIGLLDIKKQKRQPQGNSKAYIEIQLPQGMVMGIEKEVKVEKQVEGLIEGLVTRAIHSRYNNDSIEIGMIIEGVTFMLCKRIGLDVRTYLNTERYQVLNNNKEQSLKFLRICKDNYDYVYVGLGLGEIL